jgi:hypothetical protein
LKVTLQTGVLKNFPLMSMRGQVEGLLCADPEARIPIGVNENFHTALAFGRNVPDNLIV